MRDKYSIQRWFQAYLPNPAMLLLLLTREGYSVQQWSERPGTFFGVQRFEKDKSHWVVSGSIEITIIAQVGMMRQTTYTLGAGDRDFITAGTYFSKRISGDENVLYLIGEKEASKEIVESQIIEFPSLAKDVTVAEIAKVSAERKNGRKRTKNTKGKNEKIKNSRRAKRK